MAERRTRKQHRGIPEPTNGRESHTEWAVRRLRVAITEGELGPDNRLRANQLAEEWGVSPTPIREAFQRLTADGFLVYSAHRGVRVAPTSVEELKELSDLRILVEPLALRRSLESGDVSWPEDIQRALENLRDAYEARPFSFPVYEEAHHDFHSALISRSGPTWWPRIGGILLDQAARYRSLEGIEQRDFAKLMREHELIVASCVDGDVDTAVKRLERHIRRGRKTLQEPRDPE
jgi:GntR family transcriptional regulator, carbon starvation induced regulator